MKNMKFTAAFEAYDAESYIRWLNNSPQRYKLMAVIEGF